MRVDDSDPTEIPLLIGGTDNAMPIIEGVAVHGDAAFSMPLITPVAHNLWQGGYLDGYKLSPIFQHLVSLYPWKRYKLSRMRMDTEVYISMLDAEDQAMDSVDALARLVNVCRESGPVLVHCQAGLNRSSLVVARALYLQGVEFGEPIPGDFIVDLLREKRSPAVLCNPAFEAEVRSW